MRGLLAVALGAGAAAMLVVGLIGAVAVHESTRSVESLSRQLGPAQVSNARFMQDMLDAETELRAYLISGEQQQLEDHRDALARALAIEVELTSYSVDDPDVAALVERQDAAADSWISDFTLPAISAGPESARRDKTLFNLGVRLFDAVKDLNALVAERLRLRVAEARSDAASRLDMTVALMALIGVAGAVASGLIGWRVTRSTRGSLAELEQVVERLAAGGYDARVPVGGPAEIRRLGAAVNQMAEENARARAVESQVQRQLLEIDRVKTEFVANVSHELRTPLTSIAGYLELLSEDLQGEIDPEHEQMMGVMKRNVARLRSLIDDLLDLGRIERQPQRLQVVDLALLAQDVAEELRLPASDRHVTIAVETDHAPTTVQADPAQLQRALANLVSNAVKFSHDGGAVRINVLPGPGEVRVEVVDHGIGIPAAERSNVGERFFRASNAVEAHIPGTGLGLRMVQAIVSNHHGSFAVASQEGTGTTATLRLPVAPPLGAEPASYVASTDGKIPAPVRVQPSPPDSPG